MTPTGPSEATIITDITHLKDAGVIRAELETLRTMGLKSVVVDKLRELESRANRVLGTADEVSLECRYSRLLAESRSAPVASSATSYSELLSDCTASLGPEHRLTLQARTVSAQFSRKAGHADWEQQYCDILAERLGKFGPGSIKTHVARLNLSVALRDAAQDMTASAERRNEYLKRSHELTLSEWKSRIQEFTESNPFTWMAASSYVRVCLTGHYLDRPIESPERLVELAGDVVQARTRLLGATNRTALTSKITYAQTLAAAGRTEDALWRLITLRAETYLVGTAEPEHLPAALARTLLDTGTQEAQSQAEKYCRESLAIVDATYGPNSVRAGWLRHFLQLPSGGDQRATR